MLGRSPTVLSMDDGMWDYIDNLGAVILVLVTCVKVHVTDLCGRKENKMDKMKVYQN